MKNIYVSKDAFFSPPVQHHLQKQTLTVCLDLIQESLDEVTIKDTLEGDNMYTCSQCGKKVRAEKRCVRQVVE